MDMVVALDIEVCPLCEGLYFPGDDLVVTTEGLVHEYHFDTQKPKQKLALSV